MDIGIVGASGRMGQTLIRLVQADPETNLVGVSDQSGSEAIGRDIGKLMGMDEVGVKITDNPLDAFRDAQAIIDFSTPEATLANSEIAAQTRAVHVIGTTGMSEAEIAQLEPAARHAVIVRAGNMSLGVNLLTALTGQVAAALGIEYDIEIVEAHHRHKIDAPSGTALMLGQAAAQGRGVDLEANKESGRDGITGAREPGSIGFSAIRGGDIIGEHDVIFASDSERIVLRHVASDRTLFAKGALQAAKWGRHQKPGEYDMMDVLGLAKT